MSEERVMWLVLAVIVMSLLLVFGLRMFSKASAVVGGI